MNLDFNLEPISQVFKALSEPVRLRLLHLLLERDSLCVCDLVGILELNQSTVSRHLAYLKNAGLVKSWREGTWIHYALNHETLALLQINALRSRLNTLLQTDLDKLHDYERTPRICVNRVVDAP
ncbi:MAG: helix-turn-helix transcriptional regulator [Thiotrichales bacterium]|nr:helix-turn-helix transcriptional regulator [Thiotrichales bacterium]